ncbi:MAG TPA: transporter, partial [Bryobacteraceae bacterium]
MKRTTTRTASRPTSRTRHQLLTRSISTGALGLALALVSQASLADEGGVSFWIPGFYGSLAAAPLQPGWTLQTNYYHTSVSAGAEVARAREITIGKIPVTLNANLSATLDAKADLGWALPIYTFATPVLGGQASVGVIGMYGRVSTSLAGTLAGTLTTPFGTIPFSRSDGISDSVWGFGDLIPLATLRWNAGVHNYMTYITGDVPVGAYDSTRLANMGIGHGAIDAGGGYTYFDPQTGREFSGVLGFTYNLENRSTQYQNGVDMHFDWSASQFLTKQFQIGAVGYVYREIGCDSGAGDRVGCFQSQVIGAGPQLGFTYNLENQSTQYQ